VAYVRGRADYLLATWHPATRPATLDLNGEQVRWLGLKVCRVWAGSPRDNDGIVEFVARYKIGGRAYRLHETSRFVKEGGRWFYLDALPTVQGSAPGA
jgi:SEC-C motif-containing protein